MAELLFNRDKLDPLLGLKTRGLHLHLFSFSSPVSLCLQTQSYLTHDPVSVLA